MKYVVFEKEWLDIPIQDYPKGNICICHDPQKRLGDRTWSVVLVEDSDADPPSALGLFWDLIEAIRYATKYCDDHPE